MDIEDPMFQATTLLNGASLLEPRLPGKSPLRSERVVGPAGLEPATQRL
jgi:hypothetical protein